jgi:serine/threonine protein kinase
VLEATHRAGVVHRDVKPSNVQLCGRGRVVLTDFGIAATTGDGSGSCDGRVSGSPAYMAPEQVHGGEVAPASDLFSLGATLYTAVEGRSPFAKGCPAATLSAVVDEPPAPFRRAGPLGPVIEGLLAKDPPRRLDPDKARWALRVVQEYEGVAGALESSSVRSVSWHPPCPGQRVAPRPARVVTASGHLRWRLAGIPSRRYLSSPEIRLMVVARMTAPSRYESSAWRSAVARKAEVWRSVSDTWKVIPTVKAR